MDLSTAPRLAMRANPRAQSCFSKLLLQQYAHHKSLVRYADDFVLLCRKITPRLESFVTKKIEQWLGLKINRDKTRIYEVKASESGLDFLGFNFQLAFSPYGPKRRYWRIAPSKKSEQREIARVR